MPSYRARPASPRVQRGHPLARRLAFYSALAPPTGADLATGAAPTIAGSGSLAPPVAATPWGPGFACNGAKQLVYANPAFAASPPEVTVAFVFRPGATINTAAFYCPAALGSAAASNGFAPNLGPSASAFVDLRSYVGNGSGFAEVLRGPSLPSSADWAARWYAASYSYRQGSGAFAQNCLYDYAAGTLQAATGTSVQTIATPNGTVCINNPDTTANFTGDLAAVLVSYSVWSPADFASFAADPFGMVRPKITSSAWLAGASSPSARFRRVGLDGGVPTYTGGVS